MYDQPYRTKISLTLPVIIQHYIKIDIQQTLTQISAEMPIVSEVNCFQFDFHTPLWKMKIA